MFDAFRAQAREFYLAPRALSETRRLDEPARRAIAEKLARAQRERAAAEALLSAEFPVEALGMVARAITSAFEVVAEADATRDPYEALERWGISTLAAREATAAWTELRRVDLPARPEDLEQRHIELFERAIRACRVVEQAFQWVPRSRVERVSMRASRATVSLATVALMSLCVQRVAHNWPIGTATASDTFGDNSEYNNMYRASFVLDRDASTEWFLNDRKGGWVDVQLRRARDVSAVRLLNAHNGTHNDRATRGYRIELYAGQRLVAQKDGEFARFDTNPTWVTVPVRGRGVSRVRVNVLSYFALGGGLAEIDVQ